MMRDVLDDSDMATLREEQEREASIRSALMGVTAPMTGPAICPNCKGRNDRMRDGFQWCSACAEYPEWYK